MPAFINGVGAYLPGERVSIDEIDSYLGEITGVETSRYYRIIEKHAGVSCNDITDELALDQLSGNAAVNGVPVTVVPA